MRRVLACIALFAVAPTAAAQGTKADYERAAKLWEQFSAFVDDTASAPEWIDGGPRFWYLARRADRFEFMVVDPAKAEKMVAFDHAKLAKALAKAAKEEVNSKALPFERVRLDGGKVRFHAFDKAWIFDPATDTIATDTAPHAGKPQPPAAHPDSRGGQFDSSPISPDGKWEASLNDFNVTIRNRDTDASVALTDDGTQEDPYIAEFYWSPDSQRLVVMRETAVKKARVTLVESAPATGQRPRTVSYEMPLPGDKLPRRRPVLFHPHDNKKFAVRETLFPDPFELFNVRWSRDSGEFTFIYNPRGHQFLRLVAVNAETATARALFEEKSKTFVDYAHKLYLHHLDTTRELIWMSERDGWNHLYLLNAETGEVKKQLTKGEWLVRRVDRVDSKHVWFWAMGIDPKQDPYHLHYCRVNLDGTGFVTLTDGDGTHEVWISPDREYFVDTYSRVDLPPITNLRRLSDGKLILKLETADITALKQAGWQTPERFVAKGRDGKTDIHGVIFRPSNFDPKKKYPVVEEIYAGPTEFHVPKRFHAVHEPVQPLCELGFIGVMIDGMGTNWRNKAFHDVCWKNLSDAGFPDRIAWLKAAGAKYPELDLTRVGIYGGSAGGRNALRALIAHNDIYKVAVADSGNHDDRFYSMWYVELWMGYPVRPHYEQQSNVTNASKLKGKLLLVTGELDRNVNPASTMQMANALIKADKDFEMLVIPGGGHCAAESPYGSRKRMDFFVRHLLGVEPRAK